MLVIGWDAAYEVVSADDVCVGRDGFAQVGIGGRDFVDDRFAFFFADVERLIDGVLGGRRFGWSGEIGRWWFFGGCVGCCGFGGSIFGGALFEEFEALHLESEFLLLDFEVGLPAFFVALEFLDGFERVEGALVGARGFGFIAMEAGHFGEIFFGPGGLFGMAEIEFGFGFVGGAFTAKENPMVMHAAGDDAGVVIGEGFELLEGAIEQGEVVGGLLVFDEEGFGGAAVLHVAEARCGEGCRGEAGFFVCVWHAQNSTFETSLALRISKPPEKIG